jgi:hypothetical protein
MTDYILPVPYSKITSSERKKVREQYTREQGGKCYWCMQDLTDKPRKDVQAKHVNLKLFPPNFLKYPVHLQHNHDTDMTEGAVHARCNAVMWQYHGR